MPECHHCGKNVEEGARYCSSCGGSVRPESVEHSGPSVTETVQSPQVPIDQFDSSSVSIDDARFTPGTILAERYRIVGLLGKGGMGEVYRADDLKLRQPVALKFLPEALSRDRRRLERFHHEVRVAREVSHPNVCRIYDIAEADGQTFLSMEYVDGEDLAILLRRVGRPSPERAIQIARQLCAGLAAAHDKGILHRDLKPHNVMIDKQGRVRITDFGLAGFVAEFSGREIQAGTPAYMSPEQLSGQGVSVKSDIYSLGLVLYEVFTGGRLFDGATREEVSRSRSSLPTSLSQQSDSLDPAVERVIQRCLEPLPTARPSSALAVAAALPGGDPLAAALEAGETPSPEMVANAGGEGTMHPLMAGACLLTILASLIALVMGSDTLLRRIHPEKPPEVLADRAKEILASVGLMAPAESSAVGFEVASTYLRYIEKNDASSNRWDRLSNQRPSALEFWYRQSPIALVPLAMARPITVEDPPSNISGMATVWVDHTGRLLRLVINPPQVEEEQNPVAPVDLDWSTLFEAAGFDGQLLSPTFPQWTPTRYCDQRFAWTGTYPDQPDSQVRIETGSYRGKPVWFLVIDPSSTHPWQMPSDTMQSPRGNAANWFFLAVLGSILLGSLLLARHNLRLRRGDRTGANRVFTVMLIFAFLANMLRTAHVAGFEEIGRIIEVIAIALFLAAVVWLLYIALEPYVRRHWPQMLIAWGRLFAGRWRDPLVGRAILVAGVLEGLVMVTHRLVQPGLIRLAGGPPPTPASWWTPPTQMAARDLLSQFVYPFFLAEALATLFVLFGLRVLTRNRWAAVFVGVVIWITPLVLHDWSTVDGWTFRINVAMEAIHAVLIGIALIRYGLLAAAGMYFFGNLMQIAQYLDLSAWYATGPLVAFLIVLAVAGYAFSTATAGHPWFKRDLLAA